MATFRNFTGRGAWDMNPPSSPPSLAGTSASGERGRASLAGVVIVRRVRRGRDASTSDASFARDHAREEEAEETNGSPLREKRRPAGVRPFTGGARRAVGARGALHESIVVVVVVVSFASAGEGALDVKAIVIISI